MSKRNVAILIICAECKEPFHPWRGREAVSPVCSVRCNGPYQHRVRHKIDLGAEVLARCTQTPGGCWMWIGALKEDGSYGLLGFNGELLRAHCASWTAFRGPIPQGLFVCHTCDTPPCVNPDHLFLGSHDDNMADMAAKGRGTKGRPSLLPGELHPRSKLKTEDALAILVSDGPAAYVAAQYGVSESLVRGIRARTHWKHL